MKSLFSKLSVLVIMAFSAAAYAAPLDSRLYMFAVEGGYDSVLLFSVPQKDRSGDASILMRGDRYGWSTKWIRTLQVFGDMEKGSQTVVVDHQDGLLVIDQTQTDTIATWTSNSNLKQSLNLFETTPNLAENLGLPEEILVKICSALLAD